MQFSTATSSKEQAAVKRTQCAENTDLRAVGTQKESGAAAKAKVSAVAQAASATRKIVQRHGTGCAPCSPHRRQVNAVWVPCAMCGAARMSTCGAWPSCGRGVVHQAQRHAPSSHGNSGARSCGFARRAALGRAADRWPGGGKETSPGGAARCRRGAAPEKAARHAMATVKVSPRTALCYTLTSLQPALRRREGRVLPVSRKRREVKPGQRQPPFLAQTFFS